MVKILLLSTGMQIILIELEESYGKVWEFPMMVSPIPDPIDHKKISVQFIPLFSLMKNYRFPAKELPIVIEGEAEPKIEVRYLELVKEVQAAKSGITLAKSMPKI